MVKAQIEIEIKIQITKLSFEIKIVFSYGSMSCGIHNVQVKNLKTLLAICLFRGSGKFERYVLSSISK